MAMWIRAQSDFPTSITNDADFQQLADELDVCSESKLTGCPGCSLRVGCERLWGQLSEKSSHRKLSADIIKEFRDRFNNLGVLVR